MRRMSASRSITRAVLFFSCRRRHTRCGRDWSSDVCSSDLLIERGGSPERLELLVVGLVLAAEALELLVLGRQSLDEGLLVHARPPWVEGSQLMGTAGFL